MYHKEFPRVSPESVGLKSSIIQEMLERLETCGTEMHGFMLARHGKVLSECWWWPYNKDLKHICHSFGKSYMATAIGVACTEKILSVNDKIVDIFKEEIAEYGIPVTENLKKLTVEHVLTMTNGMSVHADTGAEFVRNYLSCEVDKEPGSVFMYNTAGSCMLGAIITKITGMSVRDYLTPRIFEKIGLETDKLGWISFKNGINAAPGVSANTENNLRLGMLYLNGGAWNGEQLIDREWINRATTKRVDNDFGAGHIDSRSGYGYQLWMCRTPGIYRFDGGHGQLAVMSKPHDMVIAIHQGASMPSNTEAVMDILNEYLFECSPIENLPEDENALACLRRYESTRKLASPKKKPVPEHYMDFNGIYRVMDGKFHINPELRPFDTVNVYEDFYTHPDVDVKNISIYFREPESCEVVLNDIYVLNVRMDGKIDPVRTGSEIPEYDMTYSWGYFETDGSFVIHTRYFQTCFQSMLVLKQEEDGIRIKVRKDTLHDNNPYFYYDAFAKRIV